MSLSIGGIEFKIESDNKEAIEALKAFRKELKDLNLETKEIDKQFDKLESSLKDSKTTFIGLGTQVTSLAAAFGAAVVAGGKFAAFVGVGLIAAMTAAEAAIGGVIRGLGTGLLRASQQYLQIGVELERTQFGLNAAIEAYTRATGDASLSTQKLAEQATHLQKTTGIAVPTLQQAQLIMLEMSRSTGLTSQQIETLIERAADFAVVAKQDFLDVIIAIDNAFVGLPRRLTNMGINVTEAALSMEGGSRSAAVYNKILESTEFAVGKVAQSFDTTLFGALKRSEAAWVSYDQAVAKATLTLREELSVVLANVSTNFARFGESFAPVIASIQFFGGALLTPLGLLVQFGSLLAGISLGLTAFAFLARSRVSPAITAAHGAFVRAAAGLRGMARASRFLLPGMRGLSATLAVLLALFSRFVRETLRATANILAFAARLAGPVLAAFGAVTAAIVLYNKHQKNTTEAIVDEVKARKAQISSLEKSIEAFEKLSKKTNRTKAEQAELVQVAKQLSSLAPGSVVLDEQQQILRSNLAVARAQLELVKQEQRLRQRILIQRRLEQEEIINDLQREREELLKTLEKQQQVLQQLSVVVPRNQLEKLRDILKSERTEAAREFLKVVEERLQRLGEGEGARLPENFLRGARRELIRLLKEVDDVNERLAKARALFDDIRRALGEISDDAAIKSARNLRRELELLEQREQKLRQHLSLLSQLAQLERERLELNQELDRVPDITRRIQLHALELQQLSKQEDAEKRLLLTSRQRLSLEIELLREQQKTTSTPQPEIDREIRKLQSEIALIDQSLANLDTTFRERIKNLFLSLNLFLRTTRKEFQQFLEDFNRETEQISASPFGDEEQARKNLKKQFQLQLDELKKLEDQTLKTAGDTEEKRQRIHQAFQKRRLALTKQFELESSKLTAQFADRRIEAERRRDEQEFRRKLRLKEEEIRRARELEESSTEPVRLALTARRQLLESQLRQMQREFLERELGRIQRQISRRLLQTQITVGLGAFGQEDQQARVSRQELERLFERDLAELRERLKETRAELHALRGEEARAFKDGRALVESMTSEITVLNQELSDSNREIEKVASTLREDLPLNDQIDKLQFINSLYTQQKQVLEEELRTLADIERRVVSEDQHKAIATGLRLQRERLQALIQEQKETIKLAQLQNSLGGPRTGIFAPPKGGFGKIRGVSDAFTVSLLEEELQHLEERLQKVPDLPTTLGLSDEGRIRVRQFLTSQRQELEQALSQIEQRSKETQDNIAELFDSIVRKQLEGDVAMAESALEVARIRKSSLEEELKLVAELERAKLRLAEFESRVEERKTGKISAKTEADLEVRRAAAEEAARKAGRNVVQRFGDEIKDIARETGDGFNFMRQSALSTAQFMAQSMEQFFFDVVEGRVRSLKDVFRDFLFFLRNLFLKMAAQMLAAKLLGTLGNVLGGLGGFGGGGVGGGIGGLQPLGQTGFGSAPVGGFFPKQRGGLVVGRQQFGDKVPILAETGEFVLKRSAVERLGLLNAQRINEGQIPESSFPRREEPVIIVNMTDPTEFQRFLAKNPNAVINIVSRDIQQNGRVRTMMRR